MNRIGTSLFTIALLVMLATTAFAVPTAILETKGVSPRDVAADTSDIFTKPSTGLANVGVGDWVYLEGSSTDTLDVTGWAWELTARPNGSAAALNVTDAAVVKFSPDVVGTFRVSLRVTTGNGQSEAIVMAINSANYVGVGGITGEATRGQCSMCHDDVAATWNQTKHASAWSRKYDGEAGSHFGNNCVSCHVTGYNADAGATSNGFDDRARTEGWTFIDSAHGGLVEGQWDAMKANYPQTANMGNIQCEACHGPGSAHNGNTADSKMVTSMEVGACAKCHDSGTHHFRPYQWYLSKHSSPVEEERTGCADCHSGLGFLDQLAGVPDSLSRIEYMPVNCATCHDPHDATSEHQLRTTSAYTLANGAQVDVGNGNLCINCHHSRTNSTVAAAGSINSRFGPHHGPQGDMLAGTNAFTFGQEPVRNFHAMAVENGCVGCHMAASQADPNDAGSFLKSGDHTFAMKTEEGVEHVQACAECHGEDIHSFGDIMADSDWDGDGATEGVKAEVDGLVNNLAMALPPYGEPTVTLNNDLSPVQRQAAWNWVFVKEDKSGGMHNAAFTKQILTAALAQDLGVSKVSDATPTQFSLSAPYPNPFNPISAFSYTLAKDVDVSIKVFDMAGREVATLVSGKQKAGEYKAPINMMGKASGIYLLKLEAGSFTASQKLALVK